MRYARGIGPLTNTDRSTWGAPDLSRALAAAVLGAALASSLARAQPIPAEQPPPAELELDWQAPPRCPNEEAIRARIETLLTGPPRGEGTVVVTGRIESREAGLRLRLTTDFRGRVEQRELEAPTCDELAEATAILLAIALEPGLEAVLEEVARAEPEDVEPGTELESNAVPEPQSIPEPESVPEPSSEPERPHDLLGAFEPSAPAGDAPKPHRARPAPALGLRVGATAEAGMLPGISGGPRLAFGLHWPRLRLELHGGYLAPRLAAPGGQGVLIQSGVGGLRACGRPRVGPVELPVCGGVEGGAMRGATRGFDPRRTRHAPWVGPLVSAGLALRWGRVGLWTALEAAVPVYTGEFVVESEVAHRPFPASGRVVVGLEIISKVVP
ncbi:MAG: hypothetical protein AB1Z98_36495 [Nannocystaceae bacterium]